MSERCAFVSERFFSIIVTCHNQAHTICDAVDSALRQDYPTKEVIVVDDASTDGSASFLEIAYGSLIRLCRLPANAGAAHARNAGAALATGNYLVFLDGDDALQPWALNFYRRIVERCRPKLILASLLWFRGRKAVPTVAAPSSIQYVSYEHWADKDRTFRSSASALVVERAAFQSVKGWAEDVSVFEDQYLETKLAHSGRAIQVLSPATVLYRLHDENITHDIRKLVAGCYSMVAAFRASKSPRQWRRRLASSALIGGPAFWVLQRTCRAGLLRETGRLFIRSWPMVSLAALARVRHLLFGRKPIESLVIAGSPPAS